MLAAAVAAAVASPASAVVIHGRGGRMFGVTLRRGVDPRTLAGSVASQQPQPPPPDPGTLTYHHGPVLHSSAPYLIFWDPSGQIDADSKALMQRYFTDVAAASGQSGNVYGVSRQYYDSQGFADYRQSFSPSQAVLDLQAYPTTGDCTATSSAYPTCITDGQLQAELARLIAADQLPSDGSGSEFPQSAPVYFVVLPSDVNLCNPALGSANDCASTDFCSYHASFTDGGDTVLYAAMPMLLASTNPKQCQSDGTTNASGQPMVQAPNATVADPGTADVVINDLSHEDSETITDPVQTGWWDPVSGDEEGDGCSSAGAFDPATDTDPNAFLPTLGGSASSGSLYDQLIDENHYYTQSEWSNGESNCMMRPSSGTITPSFTAAPAEVAVGSPISFDPSLSTSSEPLSSQTFDFGDGSASAFHPGAPAGVTHTFTAPGLYTVTLTLVDDRGNVASATRQVAVGIPPSAAFGFSPSAPLEHTAVAFEASASGGEITSYAWSFGDGTSGSGPLPLHTYAAPGAYAVTLTVTNSIGLTSATSQVVDVLDELPLAGFTILTPHPAAGVPVSLTAAGSSDPDGAIAAYSWNFGDGSAASGRAPRHAYKKAGSYRITLTITGSSGEQASASSEIVVLRGSRITRISVSGKGAAKVLAVWLNGAGRLAVGPRRFAVAAGRTVKAWVKPTAGQWAQLRRLHRLKLAVPVAFTPQIGAPSSTRVWISFSG